MPQILWQIEDQNVTLMDRARWGVTLRVPGAEPLAIPPMILGTWPFSLGDRKLELRSVRNLDRLRYQLWCEGRLLPRGSFERHASPGKTCADHPADPALCRCTRCMRLCCRPCSPNGIHCAPCLDELAEEDRLAAIRSRRLGIGLSIALGLAALIAGELADSRVLIKMGAGALVLVVFLYVRGVWKERKERNQGFPSAIDRR